MRMCVCVCVCVCVYVCVYTSMQACMHVLSMYNLYYMHAYMCVSHNVWLYTFTLEREREREREREQRETNGKKKMDRGQNLVNNTNLFRFHRINNRTLLGLFINEEVHIVVLQGWDQAHTHV